MKDKIQIKLKKISMVDILTRSVDASLYRIKPKKVFFPHSENDIINLFQYATQTKRAVTFRAAGTSLSGQALGNDYIADISQSFKQFNYNETTQQATSQTGVILKDINNYLAKYGRKLGPDPASENACMIGGVIANNSGGMSCGTIANPYNSITNMRFVLADGNVYDTKINGENHRFSTLNSKLYQGLLELQNKIIDNHKLYDRIVEKYKIKNVCGYGLNSFIDGKNPLAIAQKLIIGSEGTLAFVTEADFMTYPISNQKVTAFAVFADEIELSTSIELLKSYGAISLEIMDSNCFSHYIPNALRKISIETKTYWTLLIEFASNDDNETEKIKNLLIELKRTHLIMRNLIPLNDKYEIAELWKTRKGILTIAGKESKGRSLLIEDIAFPPQNFAKALIELKHLLIKFGFVDSGIFGHGIDGNVHFILNIDIKSESGLLAYEKFMDELCDLVCKCNGSMKAEHGTGRNIAPFVEREWGTELYQIMREVKNLFDPNCVLNPDVIISKDSKIHLKNLKSKEFVDELIDDCIECGFCEKACPTNSNSLTPRQRIQLERELFRQVSNEDKLQIQDLIQTDSYNSCLIDGICSTKCPVGINTGKFIAEKRQKQAKQSSKIALKIADTNFSIFKKLSNISYNLWKYQYKSKETFNFEVSKNEIIFHSCSSAIMLEKCNPVKSCCGLMYYSKGQFEKAKIHLKSFINTQVQNNSKIYLDSASCRSFIKEQSPISYQNNFMELDELLQKSNLIDLQKKSILLFMNCGSQKLNIKDNLQRIFEEKGAEIDIYDDKCCGFAGENGFLNPQTVKLNLSKLSFELKNKHYDYYLATNSTCTLGLRLSTNKKFEDISTIVI